MKKVLRIITYPVRGTIFDKHVVIIVRIFFMLNKEQLKTLEKIRATKPDRCMLALCQAVEDGITVHDHALLHNRVEKAYKEMDGKHRSGSYIMRVFKRTLTYLYNELY